MIITHAELLREYRRMKEGNNGEATHFTIDVSPLEGIGAAVSIIAYDRDMPIGIKCLGQVGHRSGADQSKRLVKKK